MMTMMMMRHLISKEIILFCLFNFLSNTGYNHTKLKVIFGIFCTVRQLPRGKIPFTLDQLVKQCYVLQEHT